jgi:uridine phosphorylase
LAFAYVDEWTGESEIKNVILNCIMETAVIAALSSLLGVSVGGFISHYLQKQRLEHEFRLKHQDNKTENMAEATVKYYLMEEQFYEFKNKTWWL